MKNLAPANHDVHPLILSRWSPRAFASTPVSQDELEQLLEAARWAPSCFNDQPWQYIVGLGQDSWAHHEIAACLVEANRVWAAKAPLLMVSVALLNFSHNGKPNRFAGHDVGLASANLALQATAMGLVVHQMGGFDAAAVSERFGLSENQQPMAAIAVGHPGAPSDLPEPLRDRELQPRARKSLEAMILLKQQG